MYKTSIEEDDFVNLSSSFFYYLSRLFNKKIGNSGDILNAIMKLQFLEVLYVIIGEKKLWI